MADVNISAVRRGGKPLIDMTGQRFGRLLVLRLSKNKKNGQTVWVCKCDCGIEKEVIGRCMRDGSALSCGCLRREKVAKEKMTHGFCRTKIYVLWSSMMSRCYNQKSHNYKNYGARGIYVCDRWKVFQNFYDDMGERPKGRSLERQNNDGPYHPDNCCWATRKEQALNTRSNVKLTKGGVTRTLKEWSEELSIPYPTLSFRWQKGWSADEILYAGHYKSGPSKGRHIAK